MKIKVTHPLISCLCITAYRTEKLLQTIINFDKQNYPNREIVISYPEEDSATRELITNIIELSGLRIITVERPSWLSIGMAKNEAIPQCNGDYICLWDDDDWYHDKRLAHQYNTMRSKAIFKEASILTHILLYDETKQRAYMSDRYLWAGSLLCKKSILLEHPFNNTNAAEDTAIINYLSDKKLLHFVEDSAFLYVYAYHGENAGDYFQFGYFLKKGEQLDRQSTGWIKSLFENKAALTPN